MLIFASGAERYAEIVADSGINAKVSREAWTGAIAAMVAAIKAGSLGDSLTAASSCAERSWHGISRPASSIRMNCPTGWRDRPSGM